MPEIVRPPCAQLLTVAETMDQMIARYRMAFRGVPSIGRWEAPKEGYTLGWLLVRNVEAVIEMARLDEALVTAAWSNARVAFELSARIIWMLQPDDRYEAEFRWLAFLNEWEDIERKLAREVPGLADRHSKRADIIQGFRVGVTSALPSGYRPARMPNFRHMLSALNNPDMYRFYREGSQYVHGGMYAAASYSKNLGNERVLGDFTYTVDWVLPMRLSWLSLREAARFILDRLEIPKEAIPDWSELNKLADAAFRKLAYHAVQSREQDA